MKYHLLYVCLSSYPYAYRTMQELATQIRDKPVSKWSFFNKRDHITLLIRSLY